MPLGLVPGARTQDQGWPFQEVHHCATHVMVAYREKNVRIYTALTTKLFLRYCTYSILSYCLFLDPQCILVQLHKCFIKSLQTIETIVCCIFRTIQTFFITVRLTQYFWPVNCDINSWMLLKFGLGFKNNINNTNSYCLFGVKKYIFFFLHFLCLIWHVIQRYG